MWLWKLHEADIPRPVGDFIKARLDGKEVLVDMSVELDILQQPTNLLVIRRPHQENSKLTYLDLAALEFPRKTKKGH
jgi:hypothetical protein